MTPVVPADPPPVRRVSIRASALVLAVLVGGTIGQVALVEPSHFASARAWVGVTLAVLHLVTQVPALASCMRRGSRRALHLYFATQIPLALAAAFASQGRLAVVVFGLVSQAVLLPRSKTLAAPVIGVLAAGAIGSVAIHEPAQAPGFAVAFATIGAFVVGFSVMLARQVDGRDTIARLATELAGANARLAAHADARVELAAARERNRIAREVHDVLGHYLTVVHVHLSAAERQLEVSPARVPALLARARAQTQEGLSELRASVSVLRRDGDRVDHALARLVTDDGPPRVRLEIDGDPRRLGEEAELALYRAAQEGITNARRHADAREVRLALSFADPVTLRVRDDGRGAASLEAGEGLRGLRERVAELGGAVEITTAPGRGFDLRVEVPG